MKLGARNVKFGFAKVSHFVTESSPIAPLLSRSVPLCPSQGRSEKACQASKRFSPRTLLLTTSLFVSGCFRVSGDAWYQGPPPRPASMEEYYKPAAGYGDYRREITQETEKYTLSHITIDSYAGPIVVDYFQGKKQTDHLVLVFPVLGGKNFIEKHIAKYLVEAGFDSAIVNRSNEFKDPAMFDHLEEVFRLNIIRDRLALDFFEGEMGKKRFGTFGISRGAINVALTAGVDKRLQYNVLVLGGTDLVHLFRDSNQPRIEKYIRSVRDSKGFSEDEFFAALQKQIKTDPKNTAQYLDGNNTLLILGLFDRTVPFEYGMKLRDQIGRPDTIFLLADHYVGLLYTQTVSVFPPSKDKAGLFPFPYIEEEAVSFYDRSFNDSWSWSILPFRLIQEPFNLLAEGAAQLGSGFEWVFGKTCEVPRDTYPTGVWIDALDAMEVDGAEPPHSVTAGGSTLTVSLKRP